LPYNNISAFLNISTTITIVRPTKSTTTPTPGQLVNNNNNDNKLREGK